ncbi:unnamed protein product [Bemisia tabaci]|uniref:DNA 3'-5' helicase n=1 Tax=Bemisia tabaci TaxID=7038 RepID=A0A9P0EX06_BEMTA|nr:unnamed protein product [Bemisia tabaci]
MDRDKALTLLQSAVGDPAATFKEDQWEAIDALVNHRKRLLVVQHTGWGKSSIYFLSTKIFRQQNFGPTIIISPLLALMNNQIETAKRFNVVAGSFNSTNWGERGALTEKVLNNEIDCLLISPERLSDDWFMSTIFSRICKKIALLVIDEAHCISVWGHDFRPDYGRIIDILQLLPADAAVVATTATATQPVIDDLKSQLGELHIIRGSLYRESLALQTMKIADPAFQLAWLAKNIPKLEGCGIMYVLRRREAEEMVKWLNYNNVKADLYHGQLSDYTHRQRLENRLLNNELKVLVATSALGMGFDKPDLGFVIHSQAPESVITYYQQVGRAGRGIDYAVGILMLGTKEEDIHEYFRRTALPSETDIRKIVQALEENNGLTLYDIKSQVNMRQDKIEKTLKYLSAEKPAPIKKDGNMWYRMPVPFNMNSSEFKGLSLTLRREKEWKRVLDYIDHPGCKMNFLQEELDDPGVPIACGKCNSCVQRLIVDEPVDADLEEAAKFFLTNPDITIPPFKYENSFELLEPICLLPAYTSPISFSSYPFREELAAAPGRALSLWGDAGWSEIVRKDKYINNHFSDLLCDATANMIGGRWKPDPFPAYVCCVPSKDHPNLVPSFAQRLASKLGLPFVNAIDQIADKEPQKDQHNSVHQRKNLDGVFKVTQLAHGPVLLVDDIVDSGLTLATVAALLREANSQKYEVYPVALIKLR